MIATVVGAGLAGTEAVWQLAKRGIRVRLIEMRPAKMTPAHKTGNFAELVCSNSLRSNQLTNAVGLLKEEMRRLDSVVMRAADETALSSGSALAVDREKFSARLTEIITSLSNVEIVHAEAVDLPEGPSILASGPLTEGKLAQAVQAFTGDSGFYFYDAASPILTRESIDFSKVYKRSRYGYGADDFLNCPMSRKEFTRFYRALITAQTASTHDFEKAVYFEGCLPVEVMAKRGEQTLLFGPMKPVGLEEQSGWRPYAVVQLRRENAQETLYNMVGFQTHLKWGEQQRVFRMIPGLESAEFVRYGVMHRNSYINAPKVLYPTYQTKKREDFFIAGQFSGVEGYVESAASGLAAGINLSRRMEGKPLVDFTGKTMIGAMAHYIASASPLHFQPMNANWGIYDSDCDAADPRKKEKDAEEALRTLERIKEEYRLG